MSDRLDEIKKRLAEIADYPADTPWQSEKDISWLIAEVELWRKRWEDLEEIVHDAIETHLKSESLNELAEAAANLKAAWIKSPNQADWGPALPRLFGALLRVRGEK